MTEWAHCQRQVAFFVLYSSYWLGTEGGSMLSLYQLYGEIYHFSFFSLFIMVINIIEKGVVPLDHDQLEALRTVLRQFRCTCRIYLMLKPG